MSGRTASGPITLRPSVRAWLQFLKVQVRSPFTLLMLAVVILNVAIHPGYLIVVGAFLLLVAVPISLWVWLKTSILAVQIDGDVVRWRAVLRRGEFRLSDVTRAQRRSLGVRRRDYAAILVRSARGKAIFRFDPIWWPPEATATLEALLQRATSPST